MSWRGLYSDCPRRQQRESRGPRGSGCDGCDDQRECARQHGEARGQHPEVVAVEVDLDRLAGVSRLGVDDAGAAHADLGVGEVMIFFRSFAKKGRSFNFSNSINYDDGNNDQSNNSITHYYDQIPVMDSSIDQLRNRDEKSFNTIFNATYTEPLSKKWNLRLNYSFNLNRKQDELSTFNRNISSGKYEDVNPALSNEIERTAWRNQLSPA